MSSLRIAFLSMIGFVAPIILLAVVFPRVFPASAGSGVFETKRHPTAEEPAAVAAANLVAPAQPEPGVPYIVVSSDSALDPVEGELFVASLLVKIQELPKVGARERLAFKFASKTKPYPGWAVAIHQFESSTRPEIYWRDRKGRGGWFAFKEVNFKRGSWYRITLLAKPDRFLNLYVQEEELVAGNTESDSKSANVIETRFVGGHDISKIRPPITDADLFLRGSGAAKSSFSADLREVIVGRSDSELETQTEAMELVGEGSKGLIKVLRETKLGLWMDESGKDLSEFKRALKR